MHSLREKAKSKGLFNLFLPKHFKESPGLTNLEYACCAEIMGRVYWAQQVCRILKWRGGEGKGWRWMLMLMGD
jgi:hypothetical protein